MAGMDDKLDSVQLNPAHLLSELHENLVDACLNKDIDEVRSLMSQVDAETVNKLLSSDAYSHSKYTGSVTVIQLVLSVNNSELLEYLISLNGFDSEQECCDGGTPLMYSCIIDNTQAVILLLRNGANPNHCTQHATPLMLAANYCSVEIVSLLLQHGADLNIGPCGRYTERASLAFYTACLRGRLEIAVEFMSVIEKKCLISDEQLILCLTLLGLQLIQQENHLEAGIALWRRALASFADLMKPRFGEVSKVQLSHSLHALYLKESALVQSGIMKKVDDNTLLKRTQSRFPDFQFCVMPDDVRDDLSASSDVVQIHDVILQGCVSEMGSWWASINLTLYNAIDSLAKGDMSVENKRLSLLVLLENALHLNQPLQILSINSSILLTTVIDSRLYVDNPGYLMLLVDCSIEACQSTFKSWSSEYLAEKRKEQKDVMGLAYRKTSQTIMSLAFLVICNDLHPSQSSYLVKLITNFTDLCKRIELIESSIFMEYTALCTVLSYTLKSDPLGLMRSGHYDNLTGNLLDLLQILLNSGMDPNARDEKGHTVMFTAIKMKEPYRSDTIELLMSYGGHVDVTNYSGHSAYKILCSLPDNNINVLDCCSLKCRAATALSFYKIPYIYVLPQSMIDFVVLHDTHTPTAPFS